MNIQKKGNGFTLVELIVVITILAILGTIAIMAFSGYSKNARDSARLSDIANIKKVLELWVMQSGTYPEPTDPTPVTFSGSFNLWNQGTFGDSVFQTVTKLDKKPVDPLYETPYTYSVANSKKEYQIAAVLEKDMASNAIIPQTYAATNKATAYVSGNYNGILATINGSLNYIVALPSIILSDLSNSNLDGTSAYQLVYEGKSNIPHSYANKNLTMTGADLSFVPKVVWSGTGYANLNNQTEFQTLASNLQAVYSSGSLFASLPEYSSIANETGITSVVLGSVKTLLETGTKQTFSNISTTPLVFCSPGSYSSTGQTPCTQTSAGYYVSTQGATSQTQCSAGYYCNAGSTTSTQTQCPANNWCAQGSSTPTACTGGFISPAGSTNSSACVFNGINATGGTITTYSTGGITYKVHTFTTVGAGTFTVTSGNGNIDYLVVAGGGGASSGDTGGAGAGGVLQGTISVTNQQYTVTVGNGGAGITGAISANAANGGNSSFANLIAIGGGASRNPGGSGGGGDYSVPGGVAGVGTGGQGYNGGTTGGTYGLYLGGGGGGSNEAGQAPIDNRGGRGGNGILSNISGSPVYYAGGGGASSTQQGGLYGYGGLGGGGDGAINASSGNGTNGLANTGGGGGGSHGGKGGDGGSGIVIIRYQIP